MHVGVGSRVEGREIRSVRPSDASKRGRTKSILVKHGAPLGTKSHLMVKWNQSLGGQVGSECRPVLDLGAGVVRLGVIFIGSGSHLVKSRLYRDTMLLVFVLSLVSWHLSQRMVVCE